MAKVIAAVIAALALSGCSASTPELVASLAKDTASICVSLTTAFPPWASTARACRTNGQGATVTVDPAGNMIMTTPPKGTAP